jgi:hypothetical protein
VEAQAAGGTVETVGDPRAGAAEDVRDFTPPRVTSAAALGGVHSYRAGRTSKIIRLRRQSSLQIDMPKLINASDLAQHTATFMCVGEERHEARG